MATRNSKRDHSFDYASQWDGPDEEELTLPSGKKVIVKSPNLSRMAKAGKIPNHMLGNVERFILGGMPMLLKEMPEVTATESEKPGAALIKTAELDEYVDVCCVAAIIEPTFVFEGEKGGIPISRMHANDKFAVWDWCVGLTETLARFRLDRSGTVADVAPVSGSDEVRDEAKQPDRIDESA